MSYTNKEVKTMQRLEAEGLTITQIAEQVGKTYTQVAYVLNRYRPAVTFPEGFTPISKVDIHQSKAADLYNGTHYLVNYKGAGTTYVMVPYEEWEELQQ